MQCPSSTPAKEPWSTRRAMARVAFFILIVLTVPTPASAQDTTGTADLRPTPEGRVTQIVLRDGSSLYGRVLEVTATPFVAPVLELGAFNGVPGFSDSKWGPMIGLQLGLGRSPVLKLTLEGDYIFVRSAASCCGPPGGLTYDDHGILGVLGLKYSLGGDKIGLELSSGIGVAGYRETRRGSIPGFVPAPPHGWQYGGIGNAGIELRASSRRGLSFTAGIREYVGLLSAALGAFRPQPALLLGIGWARP